MARRDFSSHNIQKGVRSEKESRENTLRVEIPRDIGENRQ